MTYKSKDIKLPSHENTESVRRSLLRASLQPLNVSVTNEEQKSQLQKEAAFKVINERINAFERGYQYLLSEIEKKAVDGLYSGLDNQPIPIEKFQLTSEKIKAIEKIMKEELTISEGYDLCDFPIEVELIFYDLAVYFSNQALYEKSIDAFSFLTEINPGVQAFWIGLALGNEKNNALDKAIENFKTAIKLPNFNDFTPFYGLIRCCEALNDYREAEELLEEVKDNLVIKEEIKEAIEYIKIKK